jgi:hypothetical protein
MSKSYQPMVRKTVVTNIRQFFVSEPIPPSYRSMNVEGIELENPINSGGVIVTAEGHIQALYPAYTKHNAKQRSEFYMGLSIEVVLPVLACIREGKSLDMYGLEAECSYTQIAHARTLGLNDEWVKKIEYADLERRNIVVVVRRVTSGFLQLNTATNCFDLLSIGDIILSVDDVPATRFTDIMKNFKTDYLTLNILRKAIVSSVKVPLSLLENSGTERVVGWAGALFRNILFYFRNAP